MLKNGRKEKSRDEGTFFPGSGSGSAKEKNPDPTLIRNEEKNIFIF